MFIKSPHGDSYLTDISGNIFNSSKSSEVFDAEYGQSLSKKNTFYIFLGSDSGLLINHLKKTGIPDGSRYLFIESKEVLKAIKSYLPTNRLSTDIQLCTPEQWQENAEEMQLPNYAFNNKTKIIRSLSAQKGPNANYRSIFSSLDNKINQSLWKYHIQLQDRYFIEKQLENICENRIPASILKNSFKNKTAIIMAGGPSLDELMPWIIKHRDKAVIISIARISGRLLKEELTPDIIVGIDPQDAYFPLSREMLEFSNKTLLINANYLTPLLVSQWGGHNAYLGNKFPWNSDKESENIKTVGPTVTNTAINIAHKIGCKQIILAGVDLCYSPEGFTHYSGSREHAAGALRGKVDYEITTNSGNKAGTNIAYYEAMTTISAQAKKITSSGCNVVTASPNSAKINNVQYITIDKLNIPEPLEKPAWNTIQEILDKETDQKIIESYISTRKTLEKVASKLLKIISLSSEALAYNKKLSSSSSEKQANNYHHKIDKIENSLNKGYKLLGDLIKKFNANNFKVMLQVSNTDIPKKMSIYYNAYKNGALELAAAINSTLKRVDARIEEEKPSPNFNKIIQQWDQDRQWKRSYIWTERHKKLYESLPVETQSAIKGENENFIRYVKGLDETIQMLDLEEYNIIIEKALHFFEQNNLTSLEQLKSQLDIQNPSELEEHYKKCIANEINNPTLANFVRGIKSTDQSYCRRINLLVTGLIHELKGDIDNAVAQYNQIDQNSNGWLPNKSALERLFCINLENKNYENALSALSILASKMEEYTLPYAQLLKAMGKIEDACNIYTKYISSNPDDLDAALDLGLIFKELEEQNGVNAIIELIKQKNPSHPGLKTLQS